MKTKVLKAIIQDGPITAKRLSLHIGIEIMDDRAHRIVRTIVGDLTREGWPIASGNRGFFLCKNLRDRRKYKQRLQRHLAGTKARIKAFEDAWQGFLSKKNITHYLLLSKKPKRKIKRRKL